jgi:ATP-dependent Clp protease protease subunit
MADSEIIARLLRKRTVMLGTEVTTDVTRAVIAQLLYLESVDAAAEITLFIDSPGGRVDDSLAILDTMEFIAPPVRTWVLTRAEGSAALLLAAGRRGRRFAAPNAHIALLPLWSASQDPVTLGELRRIHAEIRDRLARYSGRDAAVIAEAVDRRTVLHAKEAQLFGLVDEVRAPERGFLG